MKAIIWNYKYDYMKSTWQKQMFWVVAALLFCGVEVKKHPNFKCKGLENIPLYNFNIDKNTDICIYNHCDFSHIIGNVIPSKVNWFFKPTIPDNFHVTLDILGYAAYSSITYNKPKFEDMNLNEVKNFYDIKVKKWIEERTNKYNGFNYENKEIDIEDKDYILVVGQNSTDETVTRHDFGGYLFRLDSLIRELLRVSNKNIIVKLHPYHDGINPKNNDLSTNLKKRLESLSNRVTVYTGKLNIHNFIKKCYCVVLCNSSAGFEVMMHHKPIISFGYPEYHWVTYDLRHLADTIKALDIKTWFDSEKQDKFLYWYLEKYCFFNQVSCYDKVKELLKGEQLK